MASEERTASVKVRVSPTEKTLLEKLAGARGFASLSDFIRTAALRAPVELGPVREAAPAADPDRAAWIEQRARELTALMPGRAALIAAGREWDRAHR